MKQTHTRTHTWAIGDIHGEIDLLEKVITKIDEIEYYAQSYQPQFIFLGDYIGRGPDSIGVLLRLAEIKNDRNVRLLFGNWEKMFQKYILSPDEFRNGMTVNQAGTRIYQEIEGIGRAFFSLPEEKQVTIMTLFEQMSAAIITSQFIFSHAPIPDNTPVYNLQVSDFIKNNVNMEEKYRYQHISGKTVVCGHSRHKRVSIYNENLVIVDTGAGTGGSLSAICLDTLFTHAPVVISANRYRTFLARPDSFTEPPLLRNMEREASLLLGPSR